MAGQVGPTARCLFYSERGKKQCLHNPGWGVGRLSSLGEFKTLCTEGLYRRENKVVDQELEKMTL